MIWTAVALCVGVVAVVFVVTVIVVVLSVVGKGMSQ